MYSYYASALHSSFMFHAIMKKAPASPGKVDGSALLAEVAHVSMIRIEGTFLSRFLQVKYSFL